MCIVIFIMDCVYNRMGFWYCCAQLEKQQDDMQQLYG
jgi:hypothetical protein